MSDSGNSTCGSDFDSAEGSGFEQMNIPFTQRVTEKEPLVFTEEGLGIRVDSLTLLEGDDCVVYNEDPEYGKICLGRLVYPHTVNLIVQMEDFMPEVHIICESTKPCVVAVTGTLQEDDEQETLSGDESMEGEQSEGVTIEEAAPELVDDEAESKDGSSSEEDIAEAVGESVEDDSSEETPEEEVKPAAKPSKKDTAVHKQPAKKEAPQSAPKKQMSPAAAKAAGKASVEADTESAKPAVKTGVRKQLGRGLAYEIIEPGAGQAALSGKQVTVKYALALARTGQKMDSGILKFRLGGGDVVQGFDKGVRGMCVGEKRRIFVPAELGYGKKKVGKIPASSDLVFEVMLQSTKP